MYLSVYSKALGLKVYAVQGARPGDPCDEAEQIKQLILPLYNYIHPQSVMYETGTFDSDKYRQIQCTRSIGLPVRIPAQLRNDPVMKQMWDELLTHVEDCFVVDDR
jgi:hypothetical protein